MRCHDLELFENLLSAEDRCGSLNEQAAKRENSVVFTRHSVRTPGDALGQSALTLARPLGTEKRSGGGKSHTCNIRILTYIFHLGACTCMALEPQER